MPGKKECRSLKFQGQPGCVGQPVLRAKLGRPHNDAAILPLHHPFGPKSQMRVT